MLTVSQTKLSHQEFARAFALQCKQQLFDLRGDLPGSRLLEHDTKSTLKILQLRRWQTSTFAGGQDALDAAAVALDQPQVKKHLGNQFFARARGMHGVEQIRHAHVKR